MQALAIINFLFAVSGIVLYAALLYKKRHFFDLWAMLIMAYYAYCYWDVVTSAPTSTLMLRLAATALFSLLLGKALIEL